MKQLVIIKSVLEPKDYSTLRSLLKKQQGERITPYIFKLVDPQPVEDYLSQQKIDYEIFQKKEDLITEAELEQSYKEAAQDKERWKIGKKLETAAATDFLTRERQKK
jgi:hypothetical protein